MYLNNSLSTKYTYKCAIQCSFTKSSCVHYKFHKQAVILTMRSGDSTGKTSDGKQKHTWKRHLETDTWTSSFSTTRKVAARSWPEWKQVICGLRCKLYLEPRGVSQVYLTQ